MQQSDDGKKLSNLREGFSTEIRSQNREQNLKRMRANLINNDIVLDKETLNVLSSTTSQQNQQQDVTLALKLHIEQCLKINFSLDMFQGICEAIHSQDIFQQHYGVIGVRKILSVETPPIQPIIDANLVPTLIRFMERTEQPHLQLEAAWALTNIASGTTQQTQTIIDKGGIPLFVNLLKSNLPEVAEQAIWAIGNIAGDSSVYRDMILRNKGINHLIKIVHNSQNKNTIKHGTWAISNLCRGRPLPKFEYVEPAIPLLCKVMAEEQDTEILTDSTWALSYLSDGNEQRIQQVINTGCLSTLVKLLDHAYVSILIPVIRTIGNIATGNDEQTNLVVNQPMALQRLSLLLTHEKKPIKREACWCLSNITAGSGEQIQCIVRDKQMLDRLIHLINTEGTEIKREATWVISNCTNKGYHHDVYKLVEYGLIEIFVNNLDSDDVKTVAVVLEALKNILECGQKNYVHNGENIFLTRLDKANGIQKIEQLQTHKSEDIYKKAIRILETYFELEDPI